VHGISVTLSIFEVSLSFISINSTGSWGLSGIGFVAIIFDNNERSATTRKLRFGVWEPMWKWLTAAISVAVHSHWEAAQMAGGFNFHLG
jgi:hypothetical protein